MISLSNRIKAFASLGEIFNKVGQSTRPDSKFDSPVSELNNAIEDAVNYNGWFVESNVRYMFRSLAIALTEANIKKWIEPYKKELINKTECRTIAVVMAGNVPVVGFHDFLSVLISGDNILAKLSGDDNNLLPLLADFLMDIEPGFKEMISFTDGHLKNFDAIIATGSNNTSRYFDYYFGKYPNIIRKNRNGIAVITEDETEDDLKKISTDIFMYYGLGCRNVSHIMVPKGYDMTILLDELAKNTEVINNHKYFNNYEYNKAIFLVNSQKHFDTGNLLLTEDIRFASPVSVIYFDYYTDINLTNTQLLINKESIQCIVSVSNKIENAIPPGSSQSPQLWDYADGIDTLKFLIEL